MKYFDTSLYLQDLNLWMYAKFIKSVLIQMGWPNHKIFQVFPQNTSATPTNKQKHQVCVVVVAHNYEFWIV